jgi:hypothetical protein
MIVVMVSLKDVGAVLKPITAQFKDKSATWMNVQEGLKIIPFTSDSPIFFRGWEKWNLA